MPQDQDALRKVGRGGAGNYVPSKEADEAFKDLEAQQLKAAASVAATPSQHPHGPARVGRGGAGNFIDPKHAAQGEGLQDDETGTAVASSLRGHSQPHRAGWSGRGGAGNFHADLAAEEERARVEEDGRSRAELDRKIKEAVEGALKLPDKVHHHVHKEDEEEQG
ncbi:uncharacterized protein TRIREDRAFT_120705 [Trichoderma reesei QM6a]|uniref:Predicted protein n=2 Tax=Hypocrea jecorina TaxID=51453 RepID=G0RCV6_HYPJQ|nr:uncharacterized protein TRIREDRAFT_120705 [Trichoderma reesei QM6a]EGR50870.1 predicted protein [Trichoderma reesei QM6a]ETS05632.1 hypothetical protein M419DRAFT_107383 [Trichoderma reesei RUT C-30]